MPAGVANNVNDAKLDAVEAWIGESRRWLLDGLRLGRIDVAKANRAMCAADRRKRLIPLRAPAYRFYSPFCE